MNILNQIEVIKKEEVKKLRKEYTLSRFKDSEYFEMEQINFSEAIKNNQGISIIAEVKKASPSKGIIREDFNHLKIAEIYMNKGANAISVLTDSLFFKGSINYLNEIAKRKTVPLLRKDFIIDEYQIYEAKANGADAILLIAEMLSKNQISELTYAANEINLDVLLELHSSNQIEKIDFEKNMNIGINNRDLTTFEVDLNTINNIAEHIPKENILVAESGIKNKDDIDFIKSTRANAILVGEHFMASENINNELLKFVDWCNYEN